MRKSLFKLISALLSVSLFIGSVSVVGFTPVGEVTANAAESVITEQSGWLESAYIKWGQITNATGYAVYVKGASEADSAYTPLDDQLIRKYPGYFRADAVGLKAGDYVMKIVPFINSTLDESKAVVSQTLSVKAHTREGFAFDPNSPNKTGSGGYNDDGTVPSNAQILYITEDTKDSVTLDVITNNKGTKTTGTGLGAIMALRQKGYDKTPLIIRFIGKITPYTNLNGSNYLEVKGCYNVTLEGIGDDATAYEWSFLVRNANNVEIRNFGVMRFKDDGISIDTDNYNIWVHNNDIFYGDAGGDADQAKGDGSLDSKKFDYVTLSYNHFWDSGKSNLCGMGETAGHITYHHNWYDHSDSRHPRIRQHTVHSYNNYFDGNSKYGVGSTTSSSAFVENNYFRNCKHPMLISMQGSDRYQSGAYTAKGTFSSEDGGMIKAYGNTYIWEDPMTTYRYQPYVAGDAEFSVEFDAYEASSRNEQVPSTVKAKAGGATYNNFDTASNMYSYTPDTPDQAKANVTKYAGRINNGDFSWTFTNADDLDYGVNTELKTAIIKYTTSLVSVGGAGAGNVAPTTEASSTEPTSEVSSEDVSEESSEESTEASTVAPVVGPIGQQDHNFTDLGKESSFYTISGNLVENGKEGPIEYNGASLTDYLKMETATSITFTNGVTGSLSLIFNTGSASNTITLDGVKYTIPADGVLTINDVTAGTHEIKKGSGSSFLFYMSYSDTESVDPVDPVEPSSEVSSEASSEASSESSSEASSEAPVEKSTITSDQTLDINNYENNAYFAVSYSKLSDSNTSLHLTSGNSIKFTVVQGATVKATAKHASGTAGTADRNIIMGSTSIALKQGAGFSEVTLGENLAAGTYEITVSDAINIKSVSVTFPGTTEPDPATVTGDANNDGSVTTADVKMVLDYASGKISAVTSSTLADVNNDGKVTAYDAYLIGRLMLSLAIS